MKHSARESSTDQSVGKRRGGSEAAICLSLVLCFELEAAFCCAALVLPDDTWAALVSVPPSMPAAKIANTKRVAVAPTRRAALLMPIMRKWISLNPLQGLGYELRSLLMLLHQASEELSFSIAINAKPS